MKNSWFDPMAITPSAAWVLLRRLRYAYASHFGSSKLAGERIHVTWQRDWDVVRVIKRVAAAPPQRKNNKDAECGELWQTPLGDFWTPVGASATFMGMLSVEVLSDTYHFAAQSWRVEPIVIDCGANIGMFSRMALDRGAERVVACEPSPKTAYCLGLTFANEIGCGRLVVVQKAVWDKTETLQFSTSNEDNPGKHQVASDSAPGTVAIEATTVDCIVKQLGLPRVDFIKMDVEGAEINALQGANETIRKFRPLIGMGTEHTKDIAANNESVIRAVREIDPTYRVLCMEVHPERSPSRGLTLTPYSLFFY